MHGMEKAKDISQKKISDIKILIMNTNHTNRKIASITKVSWATVNCIKKIDKNLDLISRRKEKCSKKKWHHRICDKYASTHSASWCGPSLAVKEPATCTSRRRRDDETGPIFESAANTNGARVEGGIDTTRLCRKNYQTNLSPASVGW